MRCRRSSPKAAPFAGQYEHFRYAHACRRARASVRAGGMAAGQGAERQDVHHPRLTQASDARSAAGRGVHENAREFDFPPRRRSSAFSIRAGWVRCLRPPRGHRLLRDRSHLLLPSSSPRLRTAGCAGRHPRGTGAASRLAARRRPDDPARGLHRRRCRARSALSIRHPGATSPLPQRLVRALHHQRSLFATLPGRGATIFVPSISPSRETASSPPITAVRP